MDGELAPFCQNAAKPAKVVGIAFLTGVSRFFGGMAGENFEAVSLKLGLGLFARYGYRVNILVSNAVAA